MVIFRLLLPPLVDTPSKDFLNCEIDSEADEIRLGTAKKEGTGQDDTVSKKTGLLNVR